MDSTAEIKARVFGKDSDNDTSYSDTILDIEPECVLQQTSKPHAYRAPKVTWKYSENVLLFMSSESSVYSIPSRGTGRGNLSL